MAIRVAIVEDDLGVRETLVSLITKTADQMNISLSTVRSHLQHIYHKLHVRPRTEAVLKFLGRPREAGQRPT